MSHTLDYILVHYFYLQVKSLSPGVIAHVKEIFNDDHEENIYFATIPAMVKRGNGVEVVVRVWLGQFEKMKTQYRNKGEHHTVWQAQLFNLYIWQ